MKKGIGYLHCAIAILSAIFFAFGSMWLVDEMFLRLEEKMLSESGQLSEGASGAEFNALGDSAPSTTLTEEQILQALKNWHTAKNTVTHSPEKNQLSMDEAIQAGEEWISAMSEQGILPDKDFFTQAGYGAYDEYGEYTGSIGKNIVAILSAGFQDEEELAEIEPYYSFWNLVFDYGIISVELDINAVTGQVWYARVYPDEVFLSPDEMKEALYQFARMAGMPLDSDAEVNELESSTVLVAHEPDSKLGAFMLYKPSTYTMSKVQGEKNNDKGEAADSKKESVASQSMGEPVQYGYLELQLIQWD